jgi:hypothetical protein
VIENHSWSSRGETNTEQIAPEKQNESQSVVVDNSIQSTDYGTPVVDYKIIKKVANEEGIDWKILAAVFQKETQGDCNREGDKDFIKPSWGCYQINKHYHPEVTWEQASDLKWSTEWTAKRLKANYEKTGSWDIAIAKHNGSPSNPKVQKYLADVKRIIETL